MMVLSTIPIDHGLPGQPCLIAGADRSSFVPLCAILEGGAQRGLFASMFRGQNGDPTSQNGGGGVSWRRTAVDHTLW